MKLDRGQSPNSLSEIIILEENGCCGLNLLFPFLLEDSCIVHWRVTLRYLLSKLMLNHNFEDFSSSFDVLRGLSKGVSYLANIVQIASVDG